MMGGRGCPIGLSAGARAVLGERLKRAGKEPHRKGSHEKVSHHLSYLILAVAPRSRCFHCSHMIDE